MSTLTPILFLLDDPVAGSTVPPHPRQADPATAHVSVLDLGVTRGDGIFEALAVVDGRAQALDAHLARFRHSAAMLDLPLPATEVWRDAIERAVGRALADAPGAPELIVKTVLTRGIEGEGARGCTGWVYVEQAHDFSDARSRGLSVVTLDRGYRHDVADTSPWLLQGAKTLSYAVNKAALREAGRRGADDVIFVSTDGFVLEGPTSSVILHLDGVFVTPALDQGILAGTTQAAVFDFCHERGYRTEYRRVTPDELRRASSVWLASSVRQTAPVTAIDDEPRGFDADVNAEIVAALLARGSRIGAVSAE